jgi:hypothetical protein
MYVFFYTFPGRSSASVPLSHLITSTCPARDVASEETSFDPSTFNFLTWIAYICLANDR